MAYSWYEPAAATGADVPRPGGRRGRGSLGGAGCLGRGRPPRRHACGLLGGDAGRLLRGERAASSAARRSRSAWSAAACACGGGGLGRVPLAAAGHELLQRADGLRRRPPRRRVGGDAELRRDAGRLEVGGVSGGVRARAGEHADEDGAGGGDPEVGGGPPAGGRRTVLGTGPTGRCGQRTVRYDDGS